MGSPRSRFTDFISKQSVKDNSPITVIGVGGIGSRISETLAQIGFDLSIWDDDVVKPENVGSQIYSFSDLEERKVLALKKRLEPYNVKVESHPEKYEGQSELSGIVICGVDSKEVRAKIWETIKYNPSVPLYLDGRVGGERFKLFALNPCDPSLIDAYETQLDLTKPSFEAPCTGKFAPQAGIALAFYLWVTIQEHILAKQIPFQVAGCNFSVRTIFRS
jgi:hypothetical protein